MSLESFPIDLYYCIFRHLSNDDIISLGYTSPWLMRAMLRFTRYVYPILAIHISGNVDDGRMIDWLFARVRHYAPYAWKKAVMCKRYGNMEALLKYTTPNEFLNFALKEACDDKRMLMILLRDPRTCDCMGYGALSIVNTGSIHLLLNDDRFNEQFKIVEACASAIADNWPDRLRELAPRLNRTRRMRVLNFTAEWHFDRIHLMMPYMHRKELLALLNDPMTPRCLTKLCERACGRIM